MTSNIHRVEHCYPEEKCHQDKKIPQVDQNMDKCRLDNVFTICVTLNSLIVNVFMLVLGISNALCIFSKLEILDW